MYFCFTKQLFWAFLDFLHHRNYTLSIERKKEIGNKRYVSKSKILEIGSYMRKNKRKNRRKRIFKVCVALILFEIIMIFGTIYYYVDQAPITEHNSITITGTPENIEMLHLRQATHLYFTLNGEQYRVSGEFAEDPDVWVNQFQAEDKITAIVKNKLDFPHRSRFEE